MRTELKSLLRSCAFSAAVLFTGASASADEYILTVVPVENSEEQFQIKCVNIDKCQADALSATRNLDKKWVSLEETPLNKVMVNLNTPEDHTSFSFNIGSFQFCYTFSSSSKGGVMKITGGEETDSLQIQNRVDNQTFEIDTVKANMISIRRGNWQTEVIRMCNCNANTVLLEDYNEDTEEIPLSQTSGENYIHNLILNGAHILNDGMMKVDGIFCNINGSIMGHPAILPETSHSQNAFILRDEDLINNNSTLKEVDSKSKNCTSFSDNTSDPCVKHKDSFYELPDEGCYRFILLGNFKCSEEEGIYGLLREEDFHPVAYLPAVFGTCLSYFEAPAVRGYNRGSFISLFKNVKFVNLQIGKAWKNGFCRLHEYRPYKLQCASMGHALIIIREDDLHKKTHQETHQQTHQQESSPFSNEIKNRLIHQL